MNVIKGNNETPATPGFVKANVETVELPNNLFIYAIAADPVTALRAAADWLLDKEFPDRAKWEVFETQLIPVTIQTTVSGTIGAAAYSIFYRQIEKP